MIARKKLDLNLRGVGSLSLGFVKSSNKPPNNSLPIEVALNGPYSCSLFTANLAALRLLFRLGLRLPM